MSDTETNEKIKSDVAAEEGAKANKKPKDKKKKDASGDGKKESKKSKKVTQEGAEAGNVFDSVSTGLQNLNTIDPFAAFGNEKSDENLVHIRIQQRNGRKTLTTVQGIDEKYDLKTILKFCKKQFACNGTIVQHEEYGEILQLQGDQRKHISELLTSYQIVSENQVKIHGF